MNTYKLGQKVKVSPVKPRPPAHHKKLLRNWLLDNYEGEIVEVQGDFIMVNKHNIEFSKIIQFIMQVYIGIGADVKVELIERYSE